MVNFELLKLELELSRTFEEQYDCFEASRSEGRFSVYVREYYPKGVIDNEEENEDINNYVERRLLDNLNSETFYESDTHIYAKNGSLYSIFLCWDYTAGSIHVYRVKDLACETIYNTGLQEYSYNDLYELYQEQCNKYKFIAINI